jgi:hypothetical protein
MKYLESQRDAEIKHQDSTRKMLESENEEGRLINEGMLKNKSDAAEL